MRHSSSIVLAVLLFLRGSDCYAPVNALAGPEARPSASPPQQRPHRIISLIAILADPGKYDGKEVAVQGFFSHTHGEWVLAPDLTSLSQSIGVNCLNLDLSKCDEKQKLMEVGNPGICFLVGTFDAQDFGPRENSTLAGTFRAKKCSGVKLRPEQPSANQ